MALFVKDKRRLWNVGAVLALAIMLLWPAFMNGEPFYMPDTTSYVRGADAAVYHLTGHRSAWTGEYFKRYGSDPAMQRVPPAASGRGVNDPAAAPLGSAAQAARNANSAPVVLLGRSIYYGLLLYTSQLLGNFWAVVVLQALLVATAMALTVTVLGRALGKRRDPASVIARGLLVVIFTSAGYFASYLLPDVFGALALLAFGHLVLLWEMNWRASRLFWFVMLAVSMLFHISNFLLVSLLGLTALVLLLLRLPIAKTGLLAVAAALVIAVSGQGLFSWAVRHETGYSPIAPPFVAARIIADGPGYRYLREHCPKVQLIYCRAVSFSRPISDSLLWSADPKEGIFQALTPAEQRIAAAQQTRFVLAVFRERPFDLIGSSIGAFFRQLSFFKLTTFNYAPVNITYFDAKIPSPFIEHARQSKAYHGSMPVRLVEWTTLAAVLASVVAIVWTTGSMIRRFKRLPAAGAFLLFMVIGVLLNALICGAASTPKGRYQMRLVWVLPLAALASRRMFPWEAVELEEGDSRSQAPVYSLPGEAL